MLSEEGWTKSKNWARRLILLSVFSSLIGTTAAGFASLLLIRLTWSDLERHYLSRFVWAACPSVLSTTGTYSLLVVGSPTDQDYLATPADLVYRNGAFALTATARARGATEVWERQYFGVPHTEAYWKLRDYIYHGRSIWQLFLMPRLIGLLLIFALVWGGILREHKDRQAKRAGSVEQGPRLVTPEEFNETYRGDGIGLN